MDFHADGGAREIALTEGNPCSTKVRRSSARASVSALCNNRQYTLPASRVNFGPNHHDQDDAQKRGHYQTNQSNVIAPCLILCAAPQVRLGERPHL